MPLVAIAPLPHQDPVSRPAKYQGDPTAGQVSQAWNEFFSRLQLVVEKCPRVANEIELTLQQASITATDFSGGSLPAGLYRASHYLRITTAAGTNSSVQLVIDWTDGAVVQSETYAAVTGNTTSTQQSSSKLLRLDKNSTIRYATTYSSTGSPDMRYSLYLVLEIIPT
jgi:hypothetical protein